MDNTVISLEARLCLHIPTAVTVVIRVKCVCDLHKVQLSGLDET